MQLSLYQFSTCPYCARVLRELADLDLEVELRDVMADPSHLRDLVEGTGRQTVPCLRIEAEDGAVEWMHESGDIVDYLRGL